MHGAWHGGGRLAATDGSVQTDPHCLQSDRRTDGERRARSLSPLQWSSQTACLDSLTHHIHRQTLARHRAIWL